MLISFNKNLKHKTNRKLVEKKNLEGETFFNLSRANLANQKPFQEEDNYVVIDLFIYYFESPIS